MTIDAEPHRAAALALGLRGSRSTGISQIYTWLKTNRQGPIFLGYTKYIPGIYINDSEKYFWYIPGI
jgi:hypothetical protein